MKECLQSDCPFDFCANYRGLNLTPFAELNAIKMEDITNLPTKRKYAKDNEAAVKRRNAARTDRKPGGAINFTADTKQEIERVQSLFNRVKSFLGDGKSRAVSAKSTLEEVLQFFIAKNIDTMADRTDNDPQADNGDITDCSYARCEDLSSSRQQLFVCAESSVDKLLERIQHHWCTCTKRLYRTEIRMLGHVAMATLRCEDGHKLLWPSSPYIGDRYLANCRMAHGYLISGILPNQYCRIAEAAGIGKLGDDYVAKFFNTYKDCVKTLAKESCKDALYDEIVLYPEMDGINILTDARHGTRRNSRYTDVVCIGAESHKVLCVKTISREDERCAQKHELLGTQKIYRHLKKQDNGSVHVRVHCHDRNMSVQSWVRDNAQDTDVTNDTWHASKNVAKEVKAVCSGPRHMEGKTWHHHLSDKAASVRTHVYWSMKNCQQNAETLKRNIINITNHYKNMHDQCHATSRCKTDPNYEPSKIIIDDPKAELLLQQALQKTLVYRNPGDFIYCMDTYFVESFNNALLQYHDKRTAAQLSTDSYKFRTQLAVLDWNGHINTRAVTSTRRVVDSRNPRRLSEGRVLRKNSLGSGEQCGRNMHPPICTKQ